MNLVPDALAGPAKLRDMKSAISLLKEWLELTFRLPLLENPDAFHREKERIASMLVDNHLGKLARKVRMLGENIDLDSPAFLDEWAEIAFFTLLWTRFENLADGLMVNLVYQSGPNITRKHLADEMKLKDHFVIVGQEMSREEQLTRRSVYLFGINSQRYFLILDYVFNQQSFDMAYMVGGFYKGEVVVYPFPGALRISVVSMMPDLPPSGVYGQIPAVDIGKATQEFHSILRINPFCPNFPAMITLRSDFVKGRWRVWDLLDQEVRIAPLDEKIMPVFYAVCFRKPVRIVALMTREGIRPLSYYNGEVVRDFGEFTG